VGFDCKVGENIDGSLISLITGGFTSGCGTRTTT